LSGGGSDGCSDFNPGGGRSRGVASAGGPFGCFGSAVIVASMKAKQSEFGYSNPIVRGFKRKVLRNK
jgi:hypothetical protein